MQHATPDTVLGNFAHASFRYAGIESTFFQRDGKYFVHTDGADGKLKDFEIKFTFGVDPLQQYLIEFPDGRIQALSIAWDSRPAAQGGQRWFHLYPNDKVDSRDELHWTRYAQNWNFMCADCHSTDVHKNYDAASNTFHTTYKEISVGCEACHGPGSAHLEWARTKPKDATQGLTVNLTERNGVHWSIDAATGKPDAQQPARDGRRDPSLRAMPFAAQPNRRRIPGRTALPRLLSAGAFVAGPVLRRRTAARRGLCLGLVPAKPHVSCRSHLRRLPRTAQPEAARRRQCALRHLPPIGDVRHPGASSS